MKKKVIRNFTLALIFILAIPTLAFAATAGTPIIKVVDGIKATLTFNSETFTKENNEFTISLFDQNGQPLTNANLKVTADMDQTSSMSGMNDKPVTIDLKDGSQAGEYTGMVDLKNNGKWIIEATFNSGSIQKVVDFDFEVHNAGSNWMLIGGFACVIIIVIGVAAIFKIKSKKA